MSKQTCATCLFFSDRAGTCRRNGPTRQAPQWPLVDEGDWCGQWKSSADVPSTDKVLRVAEAIASGMYSHLGAARHTHDELARESVIAAKKLIAECEKSPDAPKAER